MNDFQVDTVGRLLRINMISTQIDYLNPLKKKTHSHNDIVYKKRLYKILSSCGLTITNFFFGIHLLQPKTQKRKDLT